MTTAVQHFTPTVTLEQRAAVRALVQSMEDAFNAKDAGALGRNLAHDAVWTNALGMRATGRDAIVALGRRMMASFSDSFARYEVAHILPLGTDACVVNLLQVPTDRDGNALDEMRAAPIYVIARRSDGWKVVAGQNTLVEDTEA